MGIKFKAFENVRDLPFWISMAGTSECDKSYYIERKNSDVYSLEYVFEGQGSVSENGESVIAVKGDVWLLHAGRTCLYYTDPEKCWKKIWVNFGGPVADALISAYGLDKFYFPQSGILSYIEEMHHVMEKNEDTRKLFDRCATIFMRICQSLNKECYEEKKTQGSIAEEMKKYIDSRSSCDISFNDMIEKMHCTKPYAIRSFKKKYNITPYNYILLRKMELAKSLLRGTETTITEIAEYLGMCDAHYFSRYFKQIVGISPSKYREKNK